MGNIFSLFNTLIQYNRKKLNRAYDKLVFEYLFKKTLSSIIKN